jgi:hypothetical protein
MLYKFLVRWWHNIRGHHMWVIGYRREHGRCIECHCGLIVPLRVSR